MWPIQVEVLGSRFAIWDVAFLVAVVVGFSVLRLCVTTTSFRDVRVDISIGRLLAAYLVTVYVTALGAQTFSYAFDAGTQLLPPAGMNPWRYYLDPVAGPKTLYGCILTLPLALVLVKLPPLSFPISLTRSLDLWTPPMLSVLAVVRVGCFLQGCCYGVPSKLLGLRFAEGSIVHAAQVKEGVIAPGEPMVAVIPAQGIEAVFLAALLAWSLVALRRGRERVFMASVVAYSVFRFAIEFVRADPARNSLGPLSTSQWVAVAVAVVGLVAARAREGSDARRRAAAT